MRKVKKNNLYRSPDDGRLLKIKNPSTKGVEIITGTIVGSKKNEKYEILGGIPDFTFPKELAQEDMQARSDYEKLAKEYDKYADIPFQTFYSSEYDERQKMTNKLGLKENSIVLEVGAGDGRGAEHIAKKLGKTGQFYVQEISIAFLRKAVDRLKKYEILTNIEYSVANAMYLPFADNAFDAALHFGGMNTFSDQKRFFKELVRVVKPGGRIVVGDESMAPWLRNTEMGRIMMNSNPLLKYNIPFDLIPVEARDVKLEWIMMGAFFVLDFTVGDGEPVANYHVPIPSERGGTHWTRYYGVIEGIDPETKKIALKARKKLGISMHKWLDDIIKREAENILNNEKE
jgi:ubiquinone/menaquinone biosynthesis C-methylase UbiE